VSRIGRQRKRNFCANSPVKERSNPLERYSFCSAFIDPLDTPPVDSFQGWLSRRVTSPGWSQMHPSRRAAYQGFRSRGRARERSSRRRNRMTRRGRSFPGMTSLDVWRHQGRRERTPFRPAAYQGYRNRERAGRSSRRRRRRHAWRHRRPRRWRAKNVTPTRKIEIRVAFQYPVYRTQFWTNLHCRAVSRHRQTYPRNRVICNFAAGLVYDLF